MKIINNLNFKITFLTVKKSQFILLILCCLFAFACKRVVKEEEETTIDSSDDKEAVSTAEMQKIMALKLPLKTVLIDKTFNLTIPESATFEAVKVEPQEESKIGEIGNIDLKKLAEPYVYVTLNNTFTHHDELYNEFIVIFKENDSTRLTIKDIKDSFGQIDFVYFEDNNSLVFEQGDSFFTVHFDYDAVHKSYIFYKAEMSWSKKYPTKQRADLFLHLLKQAKNLTNSHVVGTRFTSWEDYVQNSPALEIEIAKGMFKKLEKELKIFLTVDEKVSPRTPGNYTFVSLYLAPKDKELDFYKFVDAVKTNQLGQLSDYSFRNGVYNVSSGNVYTVKQQEGCYLIDFSSKRYNGEVYKSGVTVICPITYKNKSYFMQTADEIPAEDTDFFVKMFSFFSKNYTLDTKSN